MLQPGDTVALNADGLITILNAHTAIPLYRPDVFLGYIGRVTCVDPSGLARIEFDVEGSVVAYFLTKDCVDMVE